MRVALLSTIEAIADAGGDPQGFLPVAGRSVVQHQVEFALFMGCEKIACHAVGLPRELIELQHLVESYGARFQIIHNARALSGIVKAADELLVMADGLLVDQKLAANAVGDRPGILVFPAEEGVAAGYERIDRDYAWAGLMLVRGSAVEHLADLSPDADPVSGLLRIALQAKTLAKPMKKGTLASPDWGIVRSDAEAKNFEQNWLQKNVNSAPFYAPLLALSDRAAIHLAARSPMPRLGRIGSYLVAAALGGLAGIGGLIGYGAAGFLLAGASYTAWQLGRSASAVDAIGRSGSAKWTKLSSGLAVCLDALLVALVWMASPYFDRVTATLAAATALLVMRLGVYLPIRGWKILLSDRALLAMGLAISASFGEIAVVLQIITIVSLMAICIDSTRIGITRA